MATLNHIGIAVVELTQLKELFSILGLNVNSVQAVPEQGVITHFLPLPVEPAQLELLESTDPDGAIAQFIKKRGPGIHHLSFSVKRGELNPLCDRLRSLGYRLIYDRPRSGAHGMMINFIHPSTSEGILIELMEPG